MRHDHLVARTDPGEDRAHLECRRAGMGQECLGAADPILEPCRALLRELAVAGEMTVRMRSGDVVEFVTRQVRPVEGDPR